MFTGSSLTRTRQPQPRGFVEIYAEFGTFARSCLFANWFACARAYDIARLWTRWRGMGTDRVPTTREDARSKAFSHSDLVYEGTVEGQPSDINSICWFAEQLGLSHFSHCEALRDSQG